MSSLGRKIITTNGLIAQTSSSQFIGRTVTGTSNKIDVTNGDGISGDPTITVSATYVGQSSITTLGTITTGVWTGTTIAIANGGTGQTAKTAAFDALSPTTTKGDLIASDGTNNIRVAVGSGGKVLSANSGATAGVAWISTYSRVILADFDFSSTVTYDSAVINSTYQWYEIELLNYIPATDDTSLWIRLSTDGGSTFKSAGTDYSYAIHRVSAAAGNDIENSTGAAQILLTDSTAAVKIGNAAGEGLSGTLKIYNPSVTTTKCFLSWALNYINSAGALTMQHGTGIYNTATAVDAFRLMSSSGNLSAGNIKIYGIR